MRRVAVICAVAASLFLGHSVSAALHEYDDHTLDQLQEEWNYGYAVGDSTLMAQTFTAGLDGYLCHIEIGNTTGVYWGNDLGEQSPPVVQIWSTTDDGRPSSIIGAASVTLPDPVPSEGWTLPIDFTPYNIRVEPGQLYSIVLWADGYTGAVSVGAVAPALYGATPAYDDYLGGELWTYTYDDDNHLAWLDDAGIYDMQFRTYVVPVPLPTGAWLGICAVGVAGWHLKRQRA